MKECNSHGAVASEQADSQILPEGSGKTWERPSFVRLRAGSAELSDLSTGPDSGKIS
jgi:hypothetical protein